MEIETLQEFLFWCMLVNFGIYTLTAIAVLLLRDVFCRINSRMFGLEEETVRKSTLTYMANYKLLIAVFNFAPWIAILIIQ